VTDDFELTEAPGHLIRRLAQLHTAVFASEVGDELTSPQFAVLHVLATKGTIDQVTLGSEAGVDRTTTADLVQRLARRGLVTRQRSRLDARRNEVRLTAGGTALHRRLLPSVERVGERLLEPLSARERDQLIRLMQHLVFSLDAGGSET
jgi:DNA-binding MarR family transcriptional regulator